MAPAGLLMKARGEKHPADMASVKDARMVATSETDEGQAWDEARVKALTGGRGADVVFDPVGGKVFEASLRCTAWGGRILIIGFAGGSVPQIPANIGFVALVLSNFGLEDWVSARNIRSAGYCESVP